MKTLTKIALLFIIILASLEAKPLAIGEETANLLPYSKILLTDNNAIDDILKHEDLFRDTDKNYINLGYANQSLWLSFDIQNTQNHPVTKYIVVDSNILDTVALYRVDNNGSITKSLSGLQHRTHFDNTLSFAFQETFAPDSATHFFMEVASKTSPVHFNLQLMSKEQLKVADTDNQFKLFMFFGALGAILLLNLMFFVFTKDTSFLFYAFYLFSLILENIVYRGLTIYFFAPDGTVDQDLLNLERHIGSLVISMLALSIVLFTKNFLKTAAYPKINRILNVIAAFYIVAILLYFTGIEYSEVLKFTMLLCFITPIFIWLIGLYALYKKNRFGLYFVIGWGIVIAAIYMKVTFNLGLANEPMLSYPYYYEILLVIEALFFSFAFANKINILKEEKETLNLTLIKQQQTEQERLQELVQKRTNDLQKSLFKEQVLLKELNHRVKNNMQTIISIYRLKLRAFLDRQGKSKADDAENAVLAMSKVHTMLYKQSDLHSFDTKKYIEELGCELMKSFADKEITISYDIQTDISIKNIVYCGILLNELITNSAKHAFKDKDGHINIHIHKEGEQTVITYSDGGNKDILEMENTDSFGLKLIKIITHEQLHGTFDITNSNKLQISFKD